MGKISPYERKRNEEQKKLQLWLDAATSNKFEKALKELGYYNISETKTNKQRWFREAVDRAIDKAIKIREGGERSTINEAERGSQEVLYPLWIPKIQLSLLDNAIAIIGYKTRSQWFRDEVAQTIRKHRV